MKKFLVTALMAASVALSGCAGSVKMSDHHVAKPYGFLNEEDRDPAVQYKVSVGSVMIACIFAGSLVVPVYIIGWDLFQPVQK